MWPWNGPGANLTEAGRRPASAWPGRVPRATLVNFSLGKGRCQEHRLGSADCKNGRPEDLTVTTELAKGRRFASLGSGAHESAAGSGSSAKHAHRSPTRQGAGRGDRFLGHRPSHHARSPADQRARRGKIVASWPHQHPRPLPTGSAHSASSGPGRPPIADRAVRCGTTAAPSTSPAHGRRRSDGPAHASRCGSSPSPDLHAAQIAARPDDQRSGQRSAAR